MNQVNTYLIFRKIFGENTDNGNVIISEADQKKISLLNNIFEF